MANKLSEKLHAAELGGGGTGGSPLPVIGQGLQGSLATFFDLYIAIVWGRSSS